MSTLNRLLDDIRRDVDLIESPVLQTVSDGHVVHIAQALAANVRKLDLDIIELGELPDEWEASVRERIREVDEDDDDYEDDHECGEKEP